MNRDKTRKPYRSEEEPVETPGMHAPHDESSKRYSHPAFGQIVANRVAGNTTLYGSDFEHHAYISLRIARSELNRDLSHDWHSAKEQLIEVSLSEAQWATFVSSLNAGQGVPCTLSHIGGAPVPSIPLRRQQDAFREEFKHKVEGATARVDEAIKNIEGELGASLSGKRKDAILSELRSLRMDISSNMPFVAKSFGEHMEQTVEKAKTEVHGYMTGVIQRAGLAALAGGDTSGPIALTSGEEMGKEQPINPET